MSDTTLPADQLVPIAEAAAYLDLSVRTVRRYIHEGRITGYRVGPRLIKLNVAELDTLLRPVGGGT